MKKKIVAAIAAGLICVSATGCGKTYQEAVNASTTNEITNAGGYFTEIVRWEDNGTYKIVYANDTKVKYLIYRGYYKFGITPLYNADGTLQVYDGE